MKKIPSPCFLNVEALESRYTPAGLSPQVADNIVTGLYHQILHREPTAVEVAPYAHQLEAGVTVRRVANEFWSSLEFRNQEVSNYYQFYLGRSADVSAVGWSQALLRGVP